MCADTLKAWSACSFCLSLPFRAILSWMCGGMIKQIRLCNSLHICFVLQSEWADIIYRVGFSMRVRQIGDCLLACRMSRVSHRPSAHRHEPESSILRGRNPLLTAAPLGVSRKL